MSTPSYFVVIFSTASVCICWSGLHVYAFAVRSWFLVMRGDDICLICLKLRVGVHDFYCGHGPPFCACHCT